MKQKKKRYSIMALLGATLLLSCTEKEPVPVERTSGEAPASVTVSLQLSFEDELYGTPGTRAIDDPASAGDTEIRNLCILQFEGTDDSAPMRGLTHYYTKDADPDDPELYLRDDFKNIKLAYSDGNVHTLVILTNTFRKIPEVATLGEMLSLYRSVSGEAEVFGHGSDAGENFPADQPYYQRMNAVAVTPVNDGGVVKAVLRRSMARVNVEIDNTGRDGLRIRKVWLRNVSQKDYYVTDYSYVDENDQVQLLRETPFQDEYVTGYPQRMDYPVKTWADGHGTDNGSVSPGEGTGTATYRWYIPSNMRGTDESVTRASEKNASPNAGGATYLWILGEYGDNHDQLILYKYYLGENLVNNFDLRPNTSYSYRIRFDGKGNGEVDRRVEDMATVDFDVDANCYIVNPPVEGSRKYTFNVVHRPNIFWGSPKEGDRYNIRQDYPDYAGSDIETGETWYARILWSDVQYDANAILTRKTGTGAGNYMDASQRVELTIPSGIPEGNMVIGVCTGDPDNPQVLWSWHIWITKYQPDDIEGHAPEADTYVYHVEGGEVHRYGGAIWTTGRYKNGYAMDRNLGAMDDRYHGYARGGGFYYQFGRKDPFPASHAIYTYDYDGNMTMKPGDAVPKKPGSATGQNWRNVPFSVNNPRTYVTSDSYWTYGDVFNPSNFNSTIVWQDPYNTLRTDNEERGGNADKSFFDPCPPGWMVPVNGIWDDFVADQAGSSTTSTTVTFVWSVESINGRNRGTGKTYYPLTFYASRSNPIDPSIPTIFFPASGHRMNYSGTLNNGGGWGYIWNSSPHSLDHGCLFYFTITYPYPPASVPRSWGSSVRCVRE